MRGFFVRNPAFILLLLIVGFILYAHFNSQSSIFNSQSSISPKAANPWQTTLVHRYQSMGLSGDALGTVSALTLGWKGDLDKGVIQSFQRSGAAHVLAVSGLHTGIVYAIIVFLLTLGGRLKPLYEATWQRAIQSLCILLLLWAYAVLTGLSPSVVRSALMLTLVEIARFCSRPPLTLNIVFFSAALILAIRPADLFNVSFQLSYSAVISIVAFSSLLSSPITNHKSPITNHQSQITKHPLWGKLGRGVFDLVWVSMAAQLGTIPFTLYYFHQLSNYFLLTNLIVLPLATILVPLGLIVLVLGNVPYLGAGLVWCLQKGTELMIVSVDWVQSLPGAVVQLL